MTDQRKDEMPEEIYIFGTPDSIGDLGFTVTKPKEGHVSYVRKDLAPADGDAEMALDELQAWCKNGEPLLSNKTIGTIISALQSTRKPFRTEDASDEDIAAVEAAKYGKPPDKCDGEPSTYWSTKQDFVHPAPVDTINIKREVLQGVRDYLNEIIELSVIEWEEYSQTIDNIAAKALASLDAVLSEGE